MSTTVKCVLLDDEIPGLTYLKMLCEQIPELEVVKAYNDPQRLIHDSTSLEFDLCILDIEMPKLNGVQVASALKNKLIIFATAYREYAADAFDLDAVDFVQKPVTKERLQSAVKKAIERRSIRNHQKQPVQFNTDQGKTIIQPGDIAYITTSDVDSRDKLVVMTDNTSHVLKNISFESLQQQLPSDIFCRVNKKQIVSLKIVASFTFDWVVSTITHEGKPMGFSLNETYRNQFQEALRKIS